MLQGVQVLPNIPYSAEARKLKYLNQISSPAHPAAAMKSQTFLRFLSLAFSMPRPQPYVNPTTPKITSVSGGDQQA